MKKAVLLHGTDGKPTDQWFPWIREQLGQAGYSVFAPILPNSHAPNRETYEKFLKASGWDFTDSVLIGHSSGATTVLNLLSADWFPKVKAAVLVGAFLNEKWTKSAGWRIEGQFANLFLDHYDVDKLRKKAEYFYFVHGDNDPYCDIEDAKKLCDELGGAFITIENGHHLGDSSGIAELPQLIDVLRKAKLIDS